jgi:hypothetical protein
MKNLNKPDFSKNYKTFEEWKNDFKGSESYRHRIIREHEKYPHANLTQLRGHPSSKKKYVSELKPKPIYQIEWNKLGKRELSLRKKSLEVLGKVRKDSSLTKASKELHTSPEIVIRNTNAFHKVRGKWIAKSYDRISRVMSIYENGKQEWVEVNDSRTASRIGKYNSAVNNFLRTGNKDVLKPFKKPFKDIHKKLHSFETDPDKLYDIAEQQEEPEFYEIYKL